MNLVNNTVIIPFDDKLIRFVIKNNRQRYNGINAPYTTELCYLMCKKYINNGVSYFFSVIKNNQNYQNLNLLEKSDIENELFNTLVNCLMSFDIKKESSFALYLTRAINLRVQRLIDEFYNDLSNSSKNNRESYIYQKEKQESIKSDFTTFDLFKNISFNDTEKLIVEMILNDYSTNKIIKETNKDVYNSVIKKLKKYFYEYKSKNEFESNIIENSISKTGGNGEENVWVQLNLFN